MGYQDGRPSDARFGSIYKFEHACTSIVLIIDLENHCIRSVDRESNITTTLAGQCTHPGFVDGELRQALFKNPAEIVRKPNSQIFYVADSGRIRELNLVIRTVSTLTLEVTSIELMTVGFDGYLYFLNSTAISRLNMTTTEVEPVISTLNSNQSSIPTHAHWCDLVVVSTDVVIASDNASDTLLLLNLTDKSSSAICAKDYNISRDDETSCGVVAPCQLLLSEDMKTLLVGTSEGIVQLQISGKACRQHDLSLG